MAAYKTKRELSEAVARRLAIVDALHSPSATDSAYIEGEYDSLHIMLTDRGTVYWPNTSATTQEIPPEVFQPIVDIMCGQVNGPFGADEPVVSDERGQRIPISTRGWRNLKKHSANPASGLPTRTRFY